MNVALKRRIGDGMVDDESVVDSEDIDTQNGAVLQKRVFDAIADVGYTIDVVNCNHDDDNDVDFVDDANGGFENDVAAEKQVGNLIVDVGDVIIKVTFW